MKDRAGLGGLLAAASDHLFSVGFASDKQHVQAGGDDSRGFDVRHNGLELSLIGILALRYGHYEDRVGDIDDDTWGAGVTIPFRDVAGVRYDYGAQPQARELRRRVHKHSVSVFFDPFAIWRDQPGVLVSASTRSHAAGR